MDSGHWLLTIDVSTGQLQLHPWWAMASKNKNNKNSINSCNNRHLNWKKHHYQATGYGAITAGMRHSWPTFFLLNSKLTVKHDRGAIIPQCFLAILGINYWQNCLYFISSAFVFLPSSPHAGQHFLQHTMVRDDVYARSTHRRLMVL